MQFPNFYGNELLKQRLSHTFGSQKAGHCFILAGPEGSGKKTLTRILAAALQCESTEGTALPCGSCSACSKAFKDTHPDIITVDSDKSTVPVEVIRSMRADAFIRPNEGKRKIYIIPRAQDMMDTAQNALLKILEEPPAYCTFFLLTDSADKLLGTVRSRGVELTLSPLKDSDLINALRQLRPDASQDELSFVCEQSEGYLGAALKLLDSDSVTADPRLSDVIQAFIGGDEIGLLTIFAPMEKQDRHSVTEFVSALYQCTIKAMHHRLSPSSYASKEVQALSTLPEAKLMMLCSSLVRVISLLQANGNVGGCIGLLLASMTQ